MEGHRHEPKQKFLDEHEVCRCGAERPDSHSAWMEAYITERARELIEAGALDDLR